MRLALNSMNMTTNDFLKKILADQNVKSDDDEVTNLRKERGNIEDIINQNYSAAQKTIRYGGSYAKNTMIKSSYDLDVLCYFHEGETSAGSSLKEIYDNVKSTLEHNYYITPKRSALRLKNKDNENDFHIDVVPGRFINQNKTDAFLYQSEGEKKWLKTNPAKHIDTIRDSGLTDVIRLLKVWRCENNLKVKTFILELLVINILKTEKQKSLSEQLIIFWKKIKDSIDNIAIEDPANPNNDLSTIFDDMTKQSLKSFSEIALGYVQNDEWYKIFKYNKHDTHREEEKLVLMDTSHCALPIWPEQISTFAKVNIRCFAENEIGKNIGELKSNERVIADKWKLKYQAEPENCPANIEIFWQVVNTGNDAASEKGGLRGDKFFKGKDINGKLTNDPRINWEYTKYLGTHWIECFVVKNGYLIARSGRFFIKVRPIIRKPQVPYYRRKY